MENSTEKTQQEGEGLSKIDILEIETYQVRNTKHEYSTTSAHTVGKDSWKQVGLMLVTTFNCAYILSFSNLLLVPLGWALGSVCLVLVGGFSFYSNWLLAGLHVIDEQRFIRYRDIMGFVFGRRMYYVTWVLQFMTLILGNMGFILLGGRALKEINSEFTDSPMRLQVHVAINGFVYFVFAYVVPTMSAMRRCLVISAVLTTTYVTVLLGMVVKDGKSNKTKDYNVRGNEMDKIFNAFGAIAATLVANNPGLLPEIQSTIRKPVVNNMRKALACQFSFGLIVYYGVTVVGYWAYGSEVSDYLPKQLTGPKWGRIVINFAAFLQNIVSQNMFLSPVHEALDTNFLRLDEKLSSKRNLTRRLLLRAALLGTNTLVSAAFPFMGDCVNLLGSFALFALTFTFPSMIYLKAKGNVADRRTKIWHWNLVIVSSMLSVVTTISALRLIINNARKYRFFADT